MKTNQNQNPLNQKKVNYDNDKETSLISHIKELRQTLIKCFLAFFIALIPSLFVAPKALNLFIDFLIKGKDLQFNFFVPVEVFLVQIKLGIVIALVLSFPYIIKKIWDFILPALYEHEQNYVRKIAFFSSFLFVLGVSFCLFLLLPLLIDFAMRFTSETIQATLGLSKMLNLSLWLCVSFGLMFQMPIIIKTLVSCDIVSHQSFKEKRSYVVIALLFLAALLTPPDIISQLMLFLPTYLLFEIGLLLSRKKPEKKVHQPQAPHPYDQS